MAPKGLRGAPGSRIRPLFALNFRLFQRLKARFERLALLVQEIQLLTNELWLSWVPPGRTC